MMNWGWPFLTMVVTAVALYLLLGLIVQRRLPVRFFQPRSCQPALAAAVHPAPLGQ